MIQKGLTKQERFAFRQGMLTCFDQSESEPGNCPYVTPKYIDAWIYGFLVVHNSQKDNN